MVAVNLSSMGQYLRRYDSDAFLATLLAAPAIREDIFTLLAFRHEIETIRTKVTEPLMGRIRLQWWRDEIRAITAGGKPPAHEVLQPLAAMLKAGRLPAALLLELLEAHERDFAEAQWQSLEELQAHALAITTPVVRAQLHLAGLAMPDKLAHMAAGMGLVRLLGQGRVTPLDPAEVARQALEMLIFPRGWSRAQRQLLTSARLEKLRLQQYAACNYNRDDVRYGATPPGRGLTLARAALFG